MIKSTTSLSQVKESILSLREKPVEVTLDLGRNRKLTFSGKISGVYPALFTVCPFDREFKGKTSYSYQEYMCGRVALREAEKA